MNSNEKDLVEKLTFPIFFFFLFSPNEQIETSRRNLVIARHILMACFAGRTPSLPTLPFYHVHPKPAR